MPRCFVAVDIDDSVRARLRELQDGMRQLRVPVRMADPGGVHVTLKFLGVVGGDAVERIRQSLSRCGSCGPVEFRVKGLGAFPKLSSPRVFWVGVEPDPLQKLRACVEEALAWMGISEQREFRPHITVARTREGKRLGPLIDYIKIKGDDFDAGTVTAGVFHLYQSILEPAGARYVRLSSFPLS